MEGVGVGLGAFAFWGFIAAVTVGGIWGESKKRESQHETLRRLVESGQPVDTELMEKLMGKEPRPDRGLRTGGIVNLALCVGLVIMGLLVSQTDERATGPIVGFGCVLGCLGVGLLIASVFARRSLEEEQASEGKPPRIR